MRLPIDTGTVKFAASGPAEPILDDQSGADSGMCGRTLLLTVEEAASQLRLGRTSTYELVMRGRIQSVRIGRRRLVVRDGLKRYVAELLALQGDGPPANGPLTTVVAHAEAVSTFQR
jgi:excisionase family DNA binding protein